MTSILDSSGNPQGNKPGQPGAPAGGVVKDSDTAGFAEDVIKASNKAPVVVDFWAPWAEPCKQLSPMLEKLVGQAGGLVRLVKINVDENKELAAQLRIQSVPAVYAFANGQPVDGFVGAQPESQLRAFIDRLSGGGRPPMEQALEEAAAALDAGDWKTAGAAYQNILAQDPTLPPALGGAIRCATAAGDLAGARLIVDGLAGELASAGEVTAAVSALELAEQSTGGGDRDELMKRLAADGNDHQARFDLAIDLYGRRQNEAAVDELLELVARDRQWNDQGARKQLVKIFDALGPADPLTVSARRRLSTILFS